VTLHFPADKEDGTMAARRDKVDPLVIKVYHCYNSCVAQADRLKDRWLWIRMMEELLAALFGIEICFHSEMDNHFHLTLRSRPDVVEKLSDEEVVRRWLIITKLKRNGSTEIEEPTPEKIQAELEKPGRVETLRKRLSHVSWFMGTLSENLSRRINRADGTYGAVWAEPYQCNPLAEEADVLRCGMYIDLNEIRAGKASTPEESEHTSAYDRIASLQDAQELKRNGESPDVTNAWRPDGWMAELTIDPTLPVDSPEFFRSATGRRASDKGILEMSSTDYLQLLDWTGRQIAKNKRGAIPSELAPILERLGLDGETLVDSIVSPPRTLVSASFARHFAAVSA
jgi:hypothetical protein